MNWSEVAVVIGKLLAVYLSGVFLSWMCVRYTELWYDRGNREPVGYLVVWGWPIGAPIALAIWGVMMIVEVCGPSCSWVLDRFDRIVSSILKRKIHSDEYGTLYGMPSPLGPMRVVKVSDTTGIYWLKVPPHIMKAKEAVAWTYDKAPDHFKPQRV